ncbi:MAG: transglycosylase SLT domain-containing protein [Synergistales bacterium]|jgi:soluble lytic murein transglycosylase-like protein
MARSKPSRFLKFLAFAGVSLAILCLALQPVNALDFNFGRKPLDPSVHNALAQMKLTQQSLYKWQAEHPKSLLLQIHHWPAEKQEMAAALALYIRSQNQNVSLKDTWREAIAFVHYGEKYGLPVDMAVAVAQVESRFNPYAKSREGALGPMQVLWRIHSRLLRNHLNMGSSKDLLDPEKGVGAGCLLLSRYLKAHETEKKALTRYLGASSKSYFRAFSKYLGRFREHLTLAEI